MGFATPLTLPSNLAKESAALQIETLAAAAQASADAAEAAAAAVRGGDHGYTNRDRIFWPAISGEPMPPTLNGTEYTHVAGMSAYRCTALTLGIVVLPSVPSMHPEDDTLIALRLSVSVRLVLDTEDETTVMFTNHGSGGLVAPTVQLRRLAADSALRITTDDGATAHNEVLAADVTLGEWQRWAIVLAPTYMAFLLDDVEVARKTTGVVYPPNLTADLFRPTLRLKPASSGHIRNVAASQVELRWIEPTP